MTKSNGIASLKQAAKLLNKHSPAGESLAYINPEEAKLLRSHGGSGIQTLSGVPSYFLDKLWEGAKALGKSFLGRYKDQPAVYDEGKLIERAQSGFGNLAQDALSVWGALRAKKDQEGLNEAEQAQFDKLNQQLAAAETEFDVSTDFGAQLKPEYETDITKSAAYTPIDFSGSATPDLTTTAVAEGGRIGFQEGTHGIFSQDDLILLKQFKYDPAEVATWKDKGKGLLHVLRNPNYAQGGRIGAFNGGIQGLMPQQGIPQQGIPQQGIPQQGIPQQGLDPRMGYQMGSPHGVDIPTFSEGVNQEFPSNELGVLDAQSNIDVSNIQGKNKNKEQEIISLVQSLMQTGRYEINEAIDMVKKMLQEQENQITGQAHGGRIGAQSGGIMPLLDMGGMEKDYRQDGGFVPIGRREKADDVPARLSKNEFVFTADAVKAAGGGDIDQGAQRMYNVMKNLEAGGDISEQSQGQA